MKFSQPFLVKADNLADNCELDIYEQHICYLN